SAVVFLHKPGGVSVHPVPDPQLASTLMEWYVILAPLGYWLIGVHVLPALVHH
ncbi:cytochrome b(561), partial [Erwinia tracheiphila PSU-1]